MWRACRLVVDTGMHYLGWTRQQAIEFMADNTALTLHNITAEVDRYISWPGQVKRRRRMENCQPRAKHRPKKHSVTDSTCIPTTPYWPAGQYPWTCWRNAEPTSLKCPRCLLPLRRGNRQTPPHFSRSNRSDGKGLMSREHLLEVRDGYNSVEPRDAACVSATFWRWLSS